MAHEAWCAARGHRKKKAHSRIPPPYNSKAESNAVQVGNTDKNKSNTGKTGWVRNLNVNSLGKFSW